MATLRAAELGKLLRHGRERLSPGDVGLPAGGRRRTPGLRREEVAQLAAVGTTWYTWLEQGREISPSVGVLTAIADALRFTTSERAHLYRLAGHADEAARCTLGSVPDHLRELLRTFSPTPAAILNARMDLLAYNETYRHLVVDLDTIPANDLNCALLNFTDARFHDAYVPTPELEEDFVGRLRARYFQSLDDPNWEALLLRIRSASPRFDQLWTDSVLAEREQVVKQVRHPEVGALDIRVMPLTLPDERLRLFTILPENDTSRARLAELSRRSGGPAVSSRYGAPPAS